MRDHSDLPAAESASDLAPGDLAPRARGRLAAALGVLFALAVIAAAAAGVTFLHQRAALAPPPPLAPPPLVRVASVERVAGHAEPVAFAGRVEAFRQTALAFEQPGRIVSVAVEEGDPVEAGAVVARLDDSALAAERRRLVAVRDQAQAALALAELTLERQEGLSAAATTGQRRDDARLGRDQARAALAAAEAAIGTVDVSLERTALRAPFVGVVAARRADEGAVVEAGAPVLDLLETGRARARIGVTPETAASLRVGDTLSLHDGQRAWPARLDALRPDIDPATRTVAALFTLDRAYPPFGAVVRLEIARWISGEGVWLPATALVDGGNGLWAALVVDESVDPPVARRALVQVDAVAGESVFVRGALGEGARVIVDGGHRVAPGQAVRPEIAPEKTAAAPDPGR